MTTYKKVTANAEMAEVFPYSRAIRIGNIIEVSGTGSYDEDGNHVYAGDLYQQTKQIYSIIKKALAEAGAMFQDVVKITVFMTDISRWEEVAKAHKEYFEDIQPAVTAVQVGALIVPEMELEIEATAIVSDGSL